MISRAAGWLAVCVAAAGCEQSESPSQGPINPSFEVGAVNPDWPLDWNLFSPDGSGTRRAGTGFLPTDGIYFLSLPGRSTTTTPTTSGIRQDAVDLSATTAITFDYEAVGMVPEATDGNDGTATVEILFTSMGTTTLWSKSYPVGPVSEQVRDEMATVDMPPTAGRLTIQVTVEAGGVGGSCCQLTELEFQIDNLRVQ